jgi:hypothetical protein
MVRFQAGTQYGDWHGTAAADEPGAADDSFDKLFEATGKVDTEKEIMIGFEFYAGEGHFFLGGYFHARPDHIGAGYYPTLNEKFQKNPAAPIRVKRVSVDITLEEFFKHFKRFNVVLVDDALDIIGREYEVIED